MKPDTTHECPAKDCTERVPRSMLACRTHWFRLPKPLRDAIKSTYRKNPTSHRGNIEEAIKLLRQ